MIAVKHSIPLDVARRLGLVLLAAAIAVLLWIAVLEIFRVNPLFGSRPWQVWDYLVTSDKAAENSRVVFGNLLITLRDAGLGYLVGMIAAYVIGVFFVLNRAVEESLMPVTLLLRTMPLVVLTPLITFVFGNGVGAVVVVVVLVVFFPALVNIVFGLRSANPQLVALVRAYRGSSATLLRTVLIPSSLPATLAAARLSVPAAVTGAMIAEWLATGEGLGGSISRAAGSFGYTEMWASAVVVTAVTMLVYSAVSVVDVIVTDRFGAVAV